MRDVNWKHLQSNVYLVRTQAGLNQVLRHYNKNNYNEDSSHRGDKFMYPAIVTLGQGYQGYFYTTVEWVHVNKMKGYLEGYYD